MSDIKWKDKPWKCANCKFLLGIVSSNHNELRIKWRDLFITITDAMSVKVICRRCSRENELMGSHVCPNCGHQSLGIGSKSVINDQSQIDSKVG